MVAKRKTGGGRKPVVIPNPFIVYDEWGDPDNILWGTEDELDIRIEDILVGCIRAFNADNPTKRQDLINWQKLLRVYRNCGELTRQNIQTYLRCSESQAKRYVKVIKFTNMFIERYMKTNFNGKLRSYQHVTPEQVKAGYLTLL